MSNSSTRIVIGTAGHVDHGKTSLVKALTGTDTDRLPEEKARGISIELGFARLPLDGDRTAAVIDVPGHERFVRTMVAGATGIDLALFVIAADEGVMPQTREHLDICRLLGVSRGLVALTKIDRVDEEMRRLATDDVREAVRGTFLERAPVVPCSAVTGEGLERLRSALARAVIDAPARALDGLARLPIDRVFSVKGFGTVVTGTLAAGTLAVGEAVEILPSGVKSKVRNLEVHGEPRPRAEAGERVAANLAGIAQDQVARGDVLAPDGAALASLVVEVELTALSICPAPIGKRSRVLFHALTTHQDAHLVLVGGSALAPGDTGIAQIHLPRAVALLPGDRFVLRGFRALPGHGSTIAGGRIVRVAARPLRRPSSADEARIRRSAHAAPDELVGFELEAAGAAGITARELRARTGAAPQVLERAIHQALSRRLAVTLDRDTGRVVTLAALTEPKRRIVQALDDFHGREPLLPGISREQLRTAAGAAVDARVFVVALAELDREGLIEEDRDLVRRRGFSVTVAEARSEDLVGRVRAALAAQGLGPASLATLAQELRVTEGATSSALEILVRRGDVVRVKSDLFFHHDAVAGLRASLRDFLRAKGQITAQEFKQLTQQSRKYAIPLAEYFDAEKVTLRVGEIRKLRG
ncbi:MAG TPA: selenocysteine-specific translation elongation factor [Polyangia bacterium]|nr:selenocysteine-specific translation elongation factor [Polyangia bacterium]